MKPQLLLACLAVSASVTAFGQSSESDESPLDLGDPIVVTAEFRGTELLDLGGSATVIDRETLEQREAAHIEQILNLAPNVNVSTGASRGRFFQIRGIGARSQFVEPSNASVGLVVDGIDLTGLGAAATTLDIAQVEILRGPQGTLFGANALAGMINMVSASPTEVVSGDVRLRLAERDTRAFEGAVSGPLNEALAYRLAYSNVRSNGFRNNDFFGIDDNGAIDEQTLRGRLRWQASESLSVDFGALLLDVDNRYDGFSLDNSRTTLSDEIGHDRQETVAGSARLNWQARPDLSVEALLSHADADLEYGYDEDWSFDGFCEAFDCIFDAYSSFDNYLRENRNTTVDLRVLSGEPDEQRWVLGTYVRDQSQSLRRVYTFLADDFLSDFDTRNHAIYGQYDLPLGDALLLKAGLRYEQRDADYADSDGAAFDPDEDFWGGRLALEYRSAGGHLFYALASRGYKAGGVNSDSTVPDPEREYSTETLWNYELGIKTRLWEGRVDLRTALFYQDRDDIQTQQSLVVPIEGVLCPCRFIEYIDNATAGQSFGLETEFNWWISRSLQAYGSLGLLDSRFDGFQSFSHIEADPETGQAFDLDGRDLPHAPNYMFSLGAVFQWADHWYLRAEVEGKDAFYFSSRHEERSNAYELFNLRLGYRAGLWDLALWARNLGDATVRTRGFGSFGNDPRKGYAVEPYYQFGEPRTVGLTASYAF